MHTTTVDSHAICISLLADTAVVGGNRPRLLCPCCQPMEILRNSQAAWVDAYVAAVSPRYRSGGVLYESLCCPTAHSTVPGAPLTSFRIQYGLASWYGRERHGRRTASGEIFDS